MLCHVWALLFHSKLIIMDVATSALDTETDKAAREMLSESGFDGDACSAPI